jgi:hypothetical protein
MKIMYPLITIFFIFSFGVSALSIPGLIPKSSNSEDGIYINTIAVTELDYQCITTPCQFYSVNLSLSIVNSIVRELGSVCLGNISLKIISDGDQGKKLWFQTSEDMIKSPCYLTESNIPIGTWNENYSTTIHLVTMPSNSETIPSSIIVQLQYGSSDLKSNQFNLNFPSNKN